MGRQPRCSTRRAPARATRPLEKLAALRVLSGVPNGTITAGNSSPINDARRRAVVARATAPTANGLDVARAPCGRGPRSGVEPADTGLAPTIAIPRALDRAGMTLDDVDLFEINEAFASMTVGTIKVLGLDPDIVNVNGGAVGLGHPVACSGARIIVTLLHELRRRGGGFGVASLCAGGGMGMATVVEVPAVTRLDDLTPRRPASACSRTARACRGRARRPWPDTERRSHCLARLARQLGSTRRSAAPPAPSSTRMRSGSAVPCGLTTTNSSVGSTTSGTTVADRLLEFADLEVPALAATAGP